MANYLYDSTSFSGFDNLGLDEYFLDTVCPGDLILHFYVNRNAVIIGKNQNPWRECDLAAMERDGVELVRRVSGGGAVFHDDGNLNFSFIAGVGRDDPQRQREVILEAVRSFCIPCEFSGRNDLLTSGRKFSGNAVAVRHGKVQRHGTILIAADLDKLRRYLTVSPKKIRSKGIDSVRARVINLTEICPEMTALTMRDAVVNAFEKAFGTPVPRVLTPMEEQTVAAYRLRHGSWEWRVGETPKFDLAWDERFPWGGVELLLSLEKGVIREAHAFSDAMDTALCPDLEARLTGVPLEKNALIAAGKNAGVEIRETLDAFAKTV